MATATITFDASDYGGVDFDPRRTKVYATNNAGGSIMDSLGNHAYLGAATGTIAADGTGSITVPVPGAGFIPESWQTTIHFSHPNRSARDGRGLKSYGPFTITASGTLGSLVEAMPVQPEYASDILDRLDALEAGGGVGDLPAKVSGYTDHGNVSGSVTFTGPNASHRFDATGPTTVTLSGYSEGDVATLICFTGASSVLVTNAGDVTLVDGTAWSAELARSVWVSGGGGGEPAVPPEPDAPPPSAVLGLTAVDGSGQVSASWTAATDAESTVSYHWRVWLTSGGATGAYTTTSQTSFTKTGLAAGDYTVQVYASSAGGSTAVVSDTATATAPLTVDFLDTFTRAAGSLSANPNPDTGAAYTGPTSGATITAGGKLLPTDGGFVVSARAALAREWTAKITKPTTAGEVMVFISGQGVQFNGNGRVYTGEIGSITYNVTGGTNSWTADGYLTAGEHTVKVTRAIGGATMTVYVDDVKVLEGQGPASPTNHNVMLYRSGGDGLIDDVEVKS